MAGLAECQPMAGHPRNGAAAVAPGIAEGFDLLRLAGDIDAGNRSAVNARLLQKVHQTTQGASNLPAIASVVGFKERAVAIQKVSKSK